MLDIQFIRDNKEVVTITSDGNVFTVDKELALDNNNNIDVNYKINLSIEKHTRVVR